MLAARSGQRSRVAMTSTLRAVIRSGPASAVRITWPDGWSAVMAVPSGTVSRRSPAHGLPAAHR